MGVWVDGFWYDVDTEEEARERHEERETEIATASEEVGAAIADGVYAGPDHRENADRVRSVPIIDFETDEKLGRLYADGTLDTDDEYLRDIYEDLLEADEYGVPLMDSYYDPETDATYEGVVYIKPGVEGFLRIVGENLPSPYSFPAGIGRNLPTPDREEHGLDRPDDIDDG